MLVSHPRIKTNSQRASCLSENQFFFLWFHFAVVPVSRIFG